MPLRPMCFCGIDIFRVNGFVIFCGVDCPLNLTRRDGSERMHVQTTQVVAFPFPIYV